MTGHLRDAYDHQLRTAAELRGAELVTRIGPLWLGVFGAVGFVTYASLDSDGAGAADVRELVRGAAAHFDTLDMVAEVEWKTRSHDVAPGLTDALTVAGFAAGDAESVMIGPASGLLDAPTPAGVTLRPVETEREIRAAAELEDEVFGTDRAAAMTAELVDRMAAGEHVRLWVAEAGGTIVSAGRIDPVPGTAFAGIWGGATHPAHRGRGIYRALTAARVRSALPLGVELIHSDSTPDSRPILERAGLVAVTETVPWVRVRRA